MRLAPLFALGLSLGTACTNPAADETSGGESESAGDEVESSSSESSGPSDSSTTVEIPDCTPGAWGCECAEGDMCSPDLACIEGVCTFNDCSVGWDGCPCDAQGMCNEGLFCVEGTCGCEPGSLGCDCRTNAECEANMLSCVDAECWLPSPYPGCGWIKGSNYYFCGSNVAHPDWPIDCPVPEAELIAGMPCPDGLTFEGCCTATATYWCQDGAIATMACG